MLRHPKFWFSLAALGAVLTMSGPPQASAGPQGVVPLEQGWSEEIRQLYYYTPQGSLLIPLPWLLALDRPDGQGRFADAAYLERFGWIYDPTANLELNPAGLPIGFAIDPSERSEGPWVGFTCAACHVAEVEIGAARIRIDGAPGNLDLGRFYESLAAAVRATVVEPARLQRFAAAVLGPSPAPEKKADLLKSLALFETQISGDAAMRRSPVAPGFGRVDALNQIANALAVRDLGRPENFRTADAPVSIPHLWLTPKLEWVQWVPIAGEALGRNLGEVLGVFGSVDLRSGSDKLFETTALMPQLEALEEWVDDLKSPRWPAELLGPVDMAEAERGKALFERDCAGCHTMPPPWPEPTAGQASPRIHVGRIRRASVGTDPHYIQSFQTRTVATGQLAGPLFQDRPVAPGAVFVQTVLRAAVAKEQSATSPIMPPAAPGGAGLPPAAGVAVEDPCATLDCLKAGVLLGVWATGPFLHNGSVPTIYELLSPPEERSPVFWVGGRKLDPEKLGFVSTRAAGLFRYDTRLRGNGNGGHVFPAAGYSRDERMAVIEYLKDPNLFVAEPHL